MGSEKEDVATDFMLSEYQDLYQNVIHLENKLFSHLSFFTTLFIGIFTASIAIVQLAGNAGIPLARPIAVALLSPLFFLFFIVGRFELRMSTELRIRKIKFIEAITRIRQYFIDKDKAIGDYLVLPVGISKAPPYLRVRCKDWYQILYISLMNGIAALLSWLLPLWLIVRLTTQRVGRPTHLILTVVVMGGWIAGGLTVFYLAFWRFSYKSVVEFCRRYDEMRAEKMGKVSEYDLLEPPLPGRRLRWTFGDWIAWVTERQRGAKR